MPSTDDRIAALIERSGRLIASDAHSAGLQPVQWEALRYLGRANRFSRSPAALTAYLGATKGTVSQSLNALAAKRLIVKSTNPKDRRGKRLELTASGRRLLQSDPLRDRIASIAGLPAATKDALLSGLSEFLFAELHRRGRRSFGICKDCVHFRRAHARGEPHLCSLLDETLSVDDAERICAEQSAAV